MNGTLFQESAAAGSAAKMPLESVLNFMFAGNATFTVKSLLSGTRFTYRVRSSERPGLYFVKVVNGSQSEYLGLIRGEAFSMTRRSALDVNSQPAVLFRWLYAGLKEHRPLRGVEVWHEGKCGMCGRTLTVPESIASGFGPECSARRRV